MDDKEMVLEEEIENMKIKAYKGNEQEKELFIVLEGAIDTYNSFMFEEIINKLISSGYINIKFLCTNLNYVSSMGIGVFLNLQKAVKKNTGDISFSEVHDSVYKVFDNLGFESFFSFSKT